MKEKAFKIGLAEEYLKQLKESHNGSGAEWSVVERYDGAVYVRKEKPDGEIVLYTLPTKEI